MVNRQFWPDRATHTDSLTFELDNIAAVSGVFLYLPSNTEKYEVTVAIDFHQAILIPSITTVPLF